MVRLNLLFLDIEFTFEPTPSPINPHNNPTPSLFSRIVNSFSSSSKAESSFPLHQQHNNRSSKHGLAKKLTRLNVATLVLFSWCLFLLGSFHFNILSDITEQTFISPTNDQLYDENNDSDVNLNFNTLDFDQGPEDEEAIKDLVIIKIMRKKIERFLAFDVWDYYHKRFLDLKGGAFSEVGEEFNSSSMPTASNNHREKKPFMEEEDDVGGDLEDDVDGDGEGKGEEDDPNFLPSPPTPLSPPVNDISGVTIGHYVITLDGVLGSHPSNLGRLATFLDHVSSTCNDNNEALSNDSQAAADNKMKFTACKGHLHRRNGIGKTLTLAGCLEQAVKDNYDYAFFYEDETRMFTSDLCSSNYRQRLATEFERAGDGFVGLLGGQGFIVQEEDENKKNEINKLLYGKGNEMVNGSGDVKFRRLISSSGTYAFFVPSYTLPYLLSYWSRGIINCLERTPERIPIFDGFHLSRSDGNMNSNTCHKKSPSDKSIYYSPDIMWHGAAKEQRRRVLVLDPLLFDHPGVGNSVEGDAAADSSSSNLKSSWKGKSSVMDMLQVNHDLVDSDEQIALSAITEREVKKKWEGKTNEKRNRGRKEEYLRRKKAKFGGADKASLNEGNKFFLRGG